MNFKTFLTDFFGALPSSSPKSRRFVDLVALIARFTGFASFVESCCIQSRLSSVSGPVSGVCKLFQCEAYLLVGSAHSVTAGLMLKVFMLAAAGAAACAVPRAAAAHDRAYSNVLSSCFLFSRSSVCLHLLFCFCFPAFLSIPSCAFIALRTMST